MGSFFFLSTDKAERERSVLGKEVILPIWLMRKKKATEGLAGGDDVGGGRRGRRD